MERYLLGKMEINYFYQMQDIIMINLILNYHMMEHMDNIGHHPFIYLIKVMILMKYMILHILQKIVIHFH